MSRKARNKKHQAKQTRPGPAPSAPAPAPKVSLSGRPCDDELTLIAERLNPRQRKFCDAYLSGMMGSHSAEAAGYRDRGTAVKLLRNSDVRAYIRLMQREMAVASRVSLNTLIDRLWLQSCDPTVTQKRQDQAIAALVRIFTAAKQVPQVAVEARGNETGLDGSTVESIEEKILGVRKPSGEESA